MTIIAGTTVNWRTSPRIITIPATETSITLDDLQDTLLDLEDDDEGMLWTALRNTSGGETLSDTTNVAITMELQNAVVAFAARTTSKSSSTATSNDTTGVTLTDTGTNFVTDGVIPGAAVVNCEDGSVTTVLTVATNALTCYPLADGLNNQWAIGDDYKVWNEIQCEVTGGNLVAVNDSDVAINPVFSTFGTQVLRSTSSSATFLSSTEAENAEKWAKLAFLNS